MRLPVNGSHRRPRKGTKKCRSRRGCPRAEGVSASRRPSRCPRSGRGVVRNARRARRDFTPERWRAPNAWRFLVSPVQTARPSAGTGRRLRVAGYLTPDWNPPFRRGGPPNGAVPGNPPPPGTASLSPVNGCQLCVDSSASTIPAECSWPRPDATSSPTRFWARAGARACRVNPEVQSAAKRCPCSGLPRRSHPWGHRLHLLRDRTGFRCGYPAWTRAPTKRVPVADRSRVCVCVGYVTRFSQLRVTLTDRLAGPIRGRSRPVEQ